MRMLKNLLYLFLYILGQAIAGTVQTNYEWSLDGNMALIILGVIFMFWNRIPAYFRWTVFGVVEFYASAKVIEIAASISSMLPIGGTTN